MQLAKASGPILSKELLLEIDHEAKSILARAREKADELMQDAQSLLQKRNREAQKVLAREMARRRARALSLAGMEERNALLSLRQEETDGVVKAAQQRLIEISAAEPERFAELLWTFFSAGRDLLGESPLRVRIGVGGERVSARIEQAGGEEVGLEKDWHGLIVESIDGRVRCDYTLAVVMARCRAERGAEIEEILFEAERGS